MFVLVVLCIVMFVGCYVAGYIPLIFNYSAGNLRLITIFGAGLLVGSALAIIIPEGVATMYYINEKNIGLLHTEDGPNSRNLKSPPSGNGNKDVLAADNPMAMKHSTDEGDHGLIGVSLTLGFVLMFLVDQLPSGACCKACVRSILFCCSCRHADFAMPSANEAEAQPSALSAVTLAAAEHSAMTTTLGLVVHSLADGMAIGAAFGLTLDLTIVLFIAIMLHKAPAAFGFVSFLVHEGLPRNRVKVYLFVFALSSPLGALLTHLAVSIHTYLSIDQASQTVGLGASTKSTGFALLVSGGTFLYVATAHILPHLTSEKPTSPSCTRHPNGGHFKPLESIAFVLGSCIPVAISFGHSH